MRSSKREPEIVMVDWQANAPSEEEQALWQPEVERRAVMHRVYTVYREGPEELKPMARYAALQVAEGWIADAELHHEEDPWGSIIHWAEAVDIFALTGDLDRGPAVYQRAQAVWAAMPDNEERDLLECAPPFKAVVRFLAEGGQRRAG